MILGLFNYFFNFLSSNHRVKCECIAKIVEVAEAYVKVVR